MELIPRDGIKIKFIPRSFKNTNKNFDEFIYDNNISIILGEIGSGKTYLLKDYHERNKEISKYIELVALDYEEVISENIEVVLLDSIDEALYFNSSDKILKKKISQYILKCREVNEDVKFVIACRDSVWKEIYQSELERDKPDIIEKPKYNTSDYFGKKEDTYLEKFYFSDISENEINAILKKKKIDSNKFWYFLNRNYLEEFIKTSNIKIILFLIDNFQKYQEENLKYYEVYQLLIEELLLLTTENERNQQLKELLLNDMLKIAFAYMFFQVRNKDLIDNENKLAYEVSKLLKNNITIKTLSMVLDTALFSYSENKDIKAYLVACYLNQFDIKKIKEITTHRLNTLDVFEETLVYLTNMRPELFDEFVDINPFIFKKHPYLSASQQERLLKSILDKLQNDISIFNIKEQEFNSTLKKFDKLENVEKIIDKHVDNSKINGSLYFYLLYIISEKYCLQKLKEIIESDKQQGEEVTRYLANNMNFSAFADDFIFQLFSIMKANSFFQESSFEEKLFDYFEKSNIDFSQYVMLLDYVRYSSKKKILNRLDIRELLIYWEYIEENFNEKLHTKNKIEEIIRLLLSKEYQANLLNRIIDFSEKNSLIDKNFSLRLKYESTKKMDEYVNEFWKVYFSNRVKDIETISILFSMFDFTLEDIKKLTTVYNVDDNIEKYHLLQKDTHFIDLDDINEILSQFKSFENEKLDDDIQKNEGQNNSLIISSIEPVYVENFSNLESRKLLLNEMNFTDIAELMKNDIDNTEIYLRKLFSIDVKRTMDFFMSYYRENKKKSLYWSLIRSFEPEGLVYGGYKTYFIDEVQEEYIEELILDFYNEFDASKELKLNSSPNRFDNIDTGLWDFLNEKRILEEFRKNSNKSIINIARSKLKEIYDEEARERKIIFEEILENDKKDDIPLIITEGKTDWKHLKKALQRFNDKGEYLEIEIGGKVRFYEYDSPIKNPNQGKPILFDNIGVRKTDMGDNKLDKLHDLFIQMEYPNKTIFIFDRDNDEFVDKHGMNRFNKNGNIYSFCIPKIEKSNSPRKLDYICIEFYYKEQDLMRFYNGRRLFFADEFNEIENKNRGSKCDKYLSLNGKFKTEEYKVKEIEGKKRPELIIHSSPVYNKNDECKEQNSLLLKKNDFAENIVDKLDIDNFRLIFDIIKEIINND